MGCCLGIADYCIECCFCCVIVVNVDGSGCLIDRLLSTSNVVCCRVAVVHIVMQSASIVCVDYTFHQPTVTFTLECA